MRIQSVRPETLETSVGPLGMCLFSVTSRRSFIAVLQYVLQYRYTAWRGTYPSSRVRLGLGCLNQARVGFFMSWLKRRSASSVLLPAFFLAIHGRA